jgi:hypothetical protein
LINNWSWFYLRQNHGDHRPDFMSMERIGTILNTNTHKWLVSNGFQVSYATTDPVQLVGLLNRRRLDAVFLAEAVFKEAQLSHDRVVDYLQHIELAKPMGVYISKEYLRKEPLFMAKFDQQILEKNNQLK